MRQIVTFAVPLIVAIAPFVHAQGYAPVESPLACKENETAEECRKRLCKPDETDEECQKRIIAEREKKKGQQGQGGRADDDRDEDDDDDDRDEDDDDDDRDEAEEEREEREEEEREAREEREEEEREAREEREEEEEDDDDDDSDSGGDDILRPGTRPMFFVGAIGPEFFGLNRGRGRGALFRGSAYGDTRAKLALDFGYHFSGDFEGPAIGATIEQTFSEFFYTFNPGFKFWWDIQPVDDYGIYIAPFAKAGYALVTCSRFYYRAYGGFGSCPNHAFNIGLGVEGRLVLDDRWIVLLRPVQLDTYLGNVFGHTFWLNYSVLIGGGVSF